MPAAATFSLAEWSCIGAIAFMALIPCSLCGVWAVTIPGILFVQLVITFSLTALFVYTESIRTYVQTHMWTYILAV